MQVAPASTTELPDYHGKLFKARTHFWPLVLETWMNFLFWKIPVIAVD
jgi:hypothetical protein